MPTNFKYAQLQPYNLAGAGAIIGDTTIILKSMKDIDGNVLVMATDFGTIGFGTLDPGNGTLEEQISFSGLTNNANGTTTLTGVKSVTFVYPYTETSGLLKTHAGSTPFVISNTSGFYDKFPAKDNDEVITGQWTFNNTPIVPGTVSSATPTVQGVAFLSATALSATGPIVVGSNDPRVPVGYAVDSVGTDAYAITPTPAITAYTAGQIITFKAGTANTGSATLNVSGLGAKTITKNVTDALVTGDILAGQIITVEYDGTNMQLLSNQRINPDVQTFSADGTWAKPTNAPVNALVVVQLWGAGGGGGTGTSANCGGGGGGGYSIIQAPASSFTATAGVTIGVQGAPGTIGGNTVFGSYLTAYGGGLGGDAGGGSGAGSGAGPQGTMGGGGGGGGGNSNIGGAGGAGGGLGGNGATAPAGSYSGGGGGGGGSATGATAQGARAFYGGGGGGASDSEGLGARNGGISIYGGGGGGGGTTGPAGTSTFGGRGGTAGSPGIIPAGGGGRGSTGATGQAIITTYY